MIKIVTQNGNLIDVKSFKETINKDEEFQEYSWTLVAESEEKYEKILELLTSSKPMKLVINSVIEKDISMLQLSGITFDIKKDNNIKYIRFGRRMNVL